MALHLRIENETTLPDGGPVSITVNGKRGIDIGRDSHLDWTLPDPTRYISSKHAEIRYREGAYWLHDVSSWFDAICPGRFSRDNQIRTAMSTNPTADARRSGIAPDSRTSGVALSVGSTAPALIRMTHEHAGRTA